MAEELLDLYARASSWMQGHLPAAVENLDAGTPCDDWDVRALLNHLRDTQLYFLRSAKGEDASPPSPEPPDIFGRDASPAQIVAVFEEGREETLRAFGEAGVVERTGPALGIAFSDQLLHGWDLARATGQDNVMPEGLAEAAYDMIHGRFTDEQRKGIFKPEVTVADDASAQERLLAYSGRDPAA